MAEIHFDCFSGAAGNMILGALIDAGASPKAIRSSLDALGIDGLRMRVSRVMRGAVQARYVSFSGPDRSARDRRYRQIRALLRRAPLPPNVKERSLSVFSALARAEGRVHGIDPDRVHFHEVGALDALGDVVGVSAALDVLGVDRVTASALPLGGGTVESDHGRLPLPAPATLELLNGIPTYPYDVRWETVTPTGAALLSTLATGFGPMPALVPAAQGFGAGGDRRGPLPNVVRAILAEDSARPSDRLDGFETDRITVIETHLDDMNPEQLPYLVEQLLSDGALDCALLPIAMKKGRPGQLLRVLARPEDRERLAQRVLLESTALGVRFSEMSRLKLARESRVVRTRYGRVAVKVTRGSNGRPLAAPEYDACARAARRHEVPLAEVYRAAERAADEQLR